ncbi:UDP-2,3-diacylglucosamine diphosphatase [Tepidamorphus sp. 3E244]|uniref:UDP-2,3-diacylglucosamine diphosphatase n=1 Tax=Tepidamorphus sp. 3E244 TaxID=3385498 RepID=UPI0038FC3937
MSVIKAERTRKFRTLFVSDLHLGTRGAQAEMFLEFLKEHEADTIFLVGDIVDCWRLKRGWYWPQSHNDVVQKLLRQSRKGARIVYIPGNHDEVLRDYIGTHFGGIEVVRRTVHETANGERYLLIHGDEFDVVVRYAKWLALLGDWAYVVALAFNTQFNVARRKFGFGYWSLSAWLKLKVKNAVNFIGEFEGAVVDAARREKVDGVICGHIHHAADRIMDEVRYLNCGDWVESCTALVEHQDGTLEVIDWGAQVRAEKLVPLKRDEVAA